MTSPNPLAILGLAAALRRFNEPQHDGITVWNEIPLGFETESATRLLAHGHHLLVHQRPIDEHVDVLLTVLASGMERILKLALGYQFLSRSEGWPTNLSQWGHKIVALNNRFFKLARRHDLDGATRTAVDAVAADPILSSLLQVTEKYAVGGRYHYLDELANRTTPSPGEGTIGSWIVLLVTAFDALPGPTDEADPMDRLHIAIASSLEAWLDAISRVARSGALSPRAIAFGEHIDPAIVFALSRTTGAEGEQPIP
jgi:hypothetical protein